MNNSHPSQDTLVLNSVSVQGTMRVSTISRRIHGWSWQAYPIGMGTGAVYVCLAGLQDHRGLTVIRTIFYFMNIVLFFVNTSTLSLQLLLYPRHARKLITDSATGIYVPLVVLSFATIIIGTVNYASHVPTDFIFALFWIYVGFAVLVCFPMLMIWFNKPHDLTVYTPAWAFLVFPLMLVGVVAFNVLKVLPPSSTGALGVLLTGYIFQGLGFFMTLFYICIYVIRIMTTGFLEGHQASGAFVACGPPGFTALALIGLADESRNILSARNLISSNAGDVWYAASVMSALLLFGLAVFFFAFGALPYWFKLHKHLGEILGCWALTFPNVGWILTLRRLADIFHLNFFNIWNLIMTIMMCITWLVLFYLTALAFYKGKIFISSPEDILKESARRQEKALKEKHDLESALLANQKMVLAFAATDASLSARMRAGEHVTRDQGTSMTPQNGTRDHASVTVEQV